MYRQRQKEADFRIITPLLAHQKQARYFLTNEEEKRVFSENDKDNISLWRLRFMFLRQTGIGSTVAKPWEVWKQSKRYARPGRNDESNEASLLATEELLKKIRPRIVTLEDTFGLFRTLDNLSRFNKMIRILTKLGLSVQWKAFNLQYFGLPLPRRRVVFLTS